MPKRFARWLFVLACAGVLGALLPGPATATRPSTQAETDGVVAAVERSPLLAKVPGRPFIVTNVVVSTASESPLYAWGLIAPRRVAGRRRSAVELLLRQSPGGSWTLIDVGANFCGDARVRRAVLEDLVGISCAGSGGGSQPGRGYATLDRAVAGATRVTLVAVRGERRGGVRRASAFLEVAVGGAVVAEQTVGRVLGFDWTLLNRPGGGGVIALAAAGRGPQYVTVTLRRSARAYGTQSYTFAGNILVPARGAL